MPNRLFMCTLMAVCFSAGLAGCHNGKFRQKNHDLTEEEKERGGKIDLDQEVTNRVMLQDSVFIHFEKNWQRFIAPAREFMLPVETESKTDWQPLIFSDCSYYADAHTNVPQIIISWNEPRETLPFRLDIALHYQGFQKNYFTSVYPVEKLKRFQIPQNSQFLKDTSAVLLTGPPLFPKIVSMEQLPVATAGQTSTSYQQTPLVKQTIKITELGQGLSYRIRKCMFDGQSWKPTKEIIFTTPICPLDLK